MGKKATPRPPRPCLNNCGRQVIGRAKLCDDCNACACGRPKRHKHGTCHYCAPRSTIDERPIEWVPNGKGTMVAKHLFVARR